jgi:hypothetical protein
LAVWWWMVFVGLIPGLWHVCKTRLADALPMLFFVLGLGLLYSMMFGNVGLIFRQRAQLLPWLLIIAVYGLERRALRKFLNREARPVAPILVKDAGAPPPLRARNDFTEFASSTQYARSCSCSERI